MHILLLFLFYRVASIFAIQLCEQIVLNKKKSNKWNFNEIVLIESKVISVTARDIN